MHPYRRRRGISLVETSISGTVSLLILTCICQLARMNSLTYQRGVVDSTTQTAAELAVQRITPTLRAAMAVEPELSDAGRLTVRLPARDVAGQLIVPLVPGDLVALYLSDETGVPGAEGKILWRSVNGLPDTRWALGNGGGRVELAPDGLVFHWYPETGPEIVTISMIASQPDRGGERSFATTLEVALRNRKAVSP